MTRTLGVGKEDFADLIHKKCYYVDKTSFLRCLCGEAAMSSGEFGVNDEVLLFTRPRRFGKTLTLSMIRHFFELNYEHPEDRSGPQALFAGLEIAEDRDFCDRYMGAYPVLSLSLKDVAGQSFSEALFMLAGITGEICAGFLHLLQGSGRQNHTDLRRLSDLTALLLKSDTDWSDQKHGHES